MKHGPWKRFGLVWVFLLVGSSNPVAIKAAMQIGWPPFLLGLCRMTFIGLFFFVWAALLREHPIGPHPQARRYALTAAACKGIAVLAFYWALWLIPANRAVILSTVSPIVNVVLIHFLLEHERVRIRHLLGIALSFAGIVILLSSRHGGPAEGGASSAFGDLAMIVSVVFHQAMIIYEKKALLSGTNPRQLIISTNAVAVTAFLSLVLFVEEQPMAIPFSPAGMGIYLYLITVVGVILFYYRRWLVSVLEVSYINSYSHAGKAISILYAVVLLGERLPVASLASFALILSGTLVAVGTGRSSAVTLADPS